MDRNSALDIEYNLFIGELTERLARSFIADSSKPSKPPRKPWMGNLHQEDDHNGINFHDTNRPMEGKLSPAEAKSYWNSLGDMGKKKYKSMNTLIDPGLREDSKKPEKPKEPETQKKTDDTPEGQVVGAKGSDPIAPVDNPSGRKPPSWVEMQPEDFKEFSKRLVPAPGTGPNGRVLIDGRESGANGARKLVDPITKHEVCVKEYSTSDPMHGNNSCRAECMANRVLREVFGLLAPHSKVVDSEDVPGHRGFGKSVMSEWLQNVVGAVGDDSRDPKTMRRNIRDGVLGHPDLGKIMAAGAMSGDYDMIGPAGQNTLVVKNQDTGETNLAQIDNMGYGHCPTGGRMPIEHWEGAKPWGNPDAKNNIPYIPLKNWRDENAQAIVYNMNYIQKVMKSVGDDALSKGLSCMDGLDDSKIDQYVKDADFENLNGPNPDPSSPFPGPIVDTGKKIAETWKNRRDVLKHVNGQYRADPSKGFFNITPNEPWMFESCASVLAYILTIDASILRNILDLDKNGYPLSNIRMELMRSTSIPVFSEDHANKVSSQVRVLRDSDIERFLGYMLK